MPDLTRLFHKTFKGSGHYGFIASPLFNGPQIEIIRGIEAAMTEAGFAYYSARQDSGSDKLSPEERKQVSSWDPVFKSNEQGLDETSFMIAVLEYALPTPEDGLYLLSEHVPNNMEEVIRKGACPECFRTPGIQIEIPDAGTVWEMGYHRAQKKPVIGFHSKARPAHLNLMLSHGCDGLVLGWDNLRKFLRGGDPKKSLETSLVNRLVSRYPVTLHKVVKRFDWTACEGWNQEVE